MEQSAPSYLSLAKANLARHQLEQRAARWSGCGCGATMHQRGAAALVFACCSAGRQLPPMPTQTRVAAKVARPAANHEDLTVRLGKSHSFLLANFH